MRGVLPLIAVLSLAFAPAPFPKPIRGDLKELLGEWVLVSESYGGKVQPLRAVSITFYRDYVALKHKDGTSRWECKVWTHAQPKAFDRWHEFKEESPYARLVLGSAKGTLLIKHVYRVSGEELVTCHNINPKQSHIHPSNLSGKGGACCLQVWKRKKP
jgi:hypothetical protein